MARAGPAGQELKLRGCLITRLGKSVPTLNAFGSLGWARKMKKCQLSHPAYFEQL